MGDSEEEFDRRKSRDKFRRERNDYEARGRVVKRDMYDGGGGGGTGNRGGGNTGGNDYSNKRYNNYRERNSPNQNEPPFKRTRRDYNEEGGGAAGGGAANSRFEQGSGSGHRRDNRNDDDCPTQPPMKTFKHFLNLQDDNISDEDAMKKYKEYKEEFAKQQLHEFFEAHKEEECALLTLRRRHADEGLMLARRTFLKPVNAKFKERYHPDFCDQRNARMVENINRRLAVFMDLYEKGWVDSRKVHVDNNDNLVKLMDAVVIKLEGGTDNDLRVVDMKDTDPHLVVRTNSISTDPKDVKSEKSQADSKKKSSKKSRPYSNESDSSDDDDSSSSSSSSSSDSDSDKDVDESKRKTSFSKETRASDSKEKNNDDREEGEEEKKDDEKEVGEVRDDMDEDAPTPTTAEVPADGISKEDMRATSSIDKPGPAGDESLGATNGKMGEDLPIPQPLHKTNSIFLRNLHADVTRQEVEELCKSYPGFMRLALQDPAPERKFSRRGWVTFDRQVNIKEICWNLNNMRLKDCDLGAIVNRELTQRVRPVMVLANHKPVMRQDIKFAARMIQKLDARHNLWLDPTEEVVNKDPSNAMKFSITSRNPLMKNITDYLVDEGSYEEEALLGTGTGDTGNSSEIKIEIDDELSRVLDRLVIYLRIVHSVDYYSATEYPNEDEMPHRCGIMHARGAHIQPDKPISQRDVDEYMKQFEGKVAHLIEHVDQLTDDEAKRLGLKDVEATTEIFILDNTQELGKDKWLCPLSGKKFKGPDFIRKHILNKHMDKVEEKKKETEFHNNYIRDPKRPQLPEHPSNRSSGADRDVTSFANVSGGTRSDPYERLGHMPRQGGGDYGHSGGGPYNSGYQHRDMYDYPARSGGNYYPMQRDNYRSPPPAPYHMREQYYRGGYDRSGGDRNSGGNYYRKQYGGNYGGNKNYGGGRQRFGGGGYQRKMMSYLDLDAPQDDDV